MPPDLKPYARCNFSAPSRTLPRHSRPGFVATPHIALGVEPAKIVFVGFQTMDRYMIPDPITGKVQQGLAAIHSKERKKVVQDYVEHLIDTQASIIKSAQEY